MAVKVKNIDITTDYIWGDIKNLGSWGAVKSSNTSWQTLLKSTSITSHPVKIEIEVTEGTWESVKQLLPTWTFVKSKFATWGDLKNW